MTRSRGLLFKAGVTLIVGMIGAVGLAADVSVLAQDLERVRASGKVMAALWTRRPDSYTLQLVLPPTRHMGKLNTVASTVETAAGQAEAAAAQGEDVLDRSSFFIGNAIQKLRGLDPTFGCRTIVLVDGRRVAGNPLGMPAVDQLPMAPPVQAAPSAPQIQVWLLRADGTRIQPIWQSPQPAAVATCAARVIADEMLFRFSTADSVQAVAAAITIGDDVYIELLRPLVDEAAGR